jgi:hypothetical protein
MDALHIADKGLFLACESGIRYYIWRYAIRLDNPQKHVDSNMFGSIEPFFMSFPYNQWQVPGRGPETACSYCFFYTSWESTTLRGDAFNRFFVSLARKMGLVKQEQCVRALNRVKSCFHRAKQIWNMTPFQPDDALCYLRASEEFWWVDERQPEQLEPKPATPASATPESPDQLQNPADQALECLYKREIDARSPDKHFGHFDRSVGIWTQPRKTTTSWAPGCSNRLDAAVKENAYVPQKKLAVTAEQIWTHHVKSNALYDTPGFHEYFQMSTYIGPPLMTMQPIERNLHDQTVQWSRTAASQADHHTSIFFDYEKAFKDGLCVEAWFDPEPIPTPEPASDAIDIDSDMDAEGEDDDEPPIKRFRTDSPQDLMAASPRRNTSPPSSTRHDHQLSNLKGVMPLSPGHARSEVTVIRRDSGAQEILDVEMASPGLTNTMSVSASPWQINSMLPQRRTV